jgi:DNA-binding CsgD family transcriptional regulator/tetratricopeptide (TPR) repeat protein
MSGNLQADLPQFVGRDHELSTLRQALAESALVLIEGEAGIGKSRLVHEFLAGAADRHRILRGVCPPLHEPLMLGPIVDALQPYGQSVAGLRLSALAGVLRSLFPEWAADLPPAPEPLPDPKAARHRMFRALADLIDSLSTDVLVVEDVHWADVVTLEFLLFLASRWQQPNNRLSLVVTYRPEEVPADSLLLRLSSRLPVGSRHLRIPVPPLDQPDTARLISSMLDSGPVSEAFAGFLHQRTDGIPLAVEESVRLLRARGDLVRVERAGAGGWEWVRRKLAELQVPPTVRDAVRERVQRLSEPAQRVLQAAAVLSEPAGEHSIAAVAGLAEPDARAGLAEATAGGLLREDQRGRVAFRHVLVEQAVYQTIPSATRRELHRTAGTLLEAVEPPPLVALTRHFRAADEPAKWAHYAELTADWASESGDFDAAVVWLNDALTLTDLPTPTRLRLARRLATAAPLRTQQVDARHRQAIATLRMVLDSTGLDSPEEAELRIGLGRLLLQLGDLDGGRAEMERAVPLLAHDPVEEARAIRVLGVPFLGEKPAAEYRRWLARAAEIDPGRLPPAERLALIVERVVGLLHLGDESGWTVAAELPATAATVDERRHITRGQTNIGWSAIMWGRYAQARRLLAQAREFAAADRYERIRPQIQISELLLDWLTGRWDGLTDRVAALADPDGDEPLAVLAAVRLGQWHLAQGAYRKAETYLGRARDETMRQGVLSETLEPSAALGRLRLLEGRIAEALRETDQPMRTIETRSLWVHATDLVQVRVEALIAAGERDAAAELVSAYRDGMRDCSAPAGAAALTACQAVLAEGRGEYEAAAAGFADAARAWDRLPRPYDTLLARERQARCQLAVGHQDAALAQLAATFQALSELRARGDADRVAGRLREHGVDVRREWRRGRRGYGDQLSPRELDVVRLVATGATNREVAAALSRSPKTVAGQLSSAMRKLGATSRTELAVVALRDGLVPNPDQ